MTKDDAIRKIKALLARGDEGKNDNEYEREVALRQANALIEKFAIDATELDSDELGPRGFGHVRTGSARWKSGLVHEVATLYGCATVRHRRTRTEEPLVRVYGRRHYVNLVYNISTWLIKSIEAESSTRKPPQRSGESVRAYRNSFKVGAVAAISETIREILKDRRELVEVHSPGKGLVVVDHFEVEKEKNAAVRAKDFPYLVRGRGVSYTGSGYGAGKAYGSGLSLNTQVSGASQPRLK